MPCPAEPALLRSEGREPAPALHHTCTRAEEFMPPGRSARMSKSRGLSPCSLQRDGEVRSRQHPALCHRRLLPALPALQLPLGVTPDPCWWHWQHFPAADHGQAFPLAGGKIGRGDGWLRGCCSGTALEPDQRPPSLLFPSKSQAQGAPGKEATGE